jgi:hypothetical protein
MNPAAPERRRRTEERMDLKDYIRLELDGLDRGMKRVLDTITPEEIVWRPACGCNSIGLILFHAARSEDFFVAGALQNKPQVWETGKWYNKLNMAENEMGGHYTADQVNAFPVPKLADIMAYYAAVRQQTLDYLNSLDAAGFERKIKLPFGEFSVAGVVSLIVGHTAQHTGEMSYLRGLQRGLDK